MPHFVVISGCSGGGKSTLLSELAHRGFATVEEPGRRIVREELLGDGKALPWVDPVAFSRRAIARAQADLEAAARLSGWVFFDRGLIDAAAALEPLTGAFAATIWGVARPYGRKVFLTPPWPEIYQTDAERRHSLADAIPEYERLLKVYPALGYEVTLLPRIPVAARADLVLETLGVAI